ncbi:hypothetical protein [Aquibacillus rhizosphaerae]|uniref:DUF3168 domain-containing protein n=1 Tax=Aquibacillus rhizosphaerae TaxID=3051431 RepID=A0ABT7LAC9_9BACI|nr:hypothetical protein [Aquibacillus sp. LR5S19]MDL4842836.1 hypothetical protein [Aquibacillus sp. LR5S19]
MESPKIQLFNTVFKKSLALNYSTYDYSPPKEQGVPYPFVHVGETIGADVINNKTVITGTLTQTVHVWALATDRATFADMVHKLEKEFRKITRLTNYNVRLIALDSNEIYDNTTTDNLLHGIIQVEYKIS